MTTSDTGTITAAPLAGVMVILPLYEPGLNPTGFTVTVSSDGVAPVPGVMLSQLFCESVETLIVKPVAGADESCTNCCENVGACTVGDVNTNDAGVAVIGVADPIVRETGTNTVAFPADCSASCAVYVPATSVWKFDTDKSSEDGVLPKAPLVMKSHDPPVEFTILAEYGSGEPLDEVRFTTTSPGLFVDPAGAEKLTVDGLATIAPCVPPPPPAPEIDNRKFALEERPQTSVIVNPKL